MERLIVKNFGPIKHIDIEIKDVNVFIGDNSTGKSTVAKLLGIFQTKSQSLTDINFLLKQFVDYNIDFTVSSETTIKYDFDECYIELRNYEVHSNADLAYLDWIYKDVEINDISSLLNSPERFDKLPKFSNSSASQRLTGILSEIEEYRKSKESRIEN
jgi:predicted ATP-dependent endonuclease of OLD family